MLYNRRLSPVQTGPEEQGQERRPNMAEYRGNSGREGAQNLVHLRLDNRNAYRPDLYPLRWK